MVVELKSCEHLTGEHQAQLINYLAVTNLEVGLLVNFGKRKLDYKRAHHPVHHATCDHADPVLFLRIKNACILKEKSSCKNYIKQQKIGSYF